MVKITALEIEQLFKLMIEIIQKEGIDEFEIPVDEYWVVLTDEWNNFKITPELGVGSLEEDIKFLKEAIQEGEMFSFIEFEKVAQVLRAISEKMVPTK